MLISHPRKSRRVLRRLSAVCAGLVLAAVLAEGWLRVASPIPPQFLLPLPYHHEDLRRIVDGETYIRFDSTLGWIPAPDETHRGGEGEAIVYRTNRASLRAERQFAEQPAPDVRRIAAFGDSFTYCEEVDLADCWTAQLEMARAGTEVLNFGVPGYGPDQAWLRYQRDGAAYQPCAVLIGHMVENINRVVNRFRPFYEPAGGLILSKPRFLLDGQGLSLLPNPVTDPTQLDDPGWVEATLGPHDHWYFPGVFVGNPFDASRLVRLARTAAYRRRPEDLEFTRDWASQVAQAYRGEGEAFQVTARILTEFARQVQRNGASPVVVIFGSEIEIRALRQRGGEKAYAPLLRWLEREGIPTVDVTDNLAQQADRSGVSRIVENHYRQLGNKVVAQTLGNRLTALTRATCGG